MMVPWSQYAPKSVIAKKLQKEILVVEDLLSRDQKTFTEVADMLLTKILRESVTSKRIDVVFDEYIERCQ